MQRIRPGFRLNADHSAGCAPIFRRKRRSENLEFLHRIHSRRYGDVLRAVRRRFHAVDHDRVRVAALAVDAYAEAVHGAVGRYHARRQSRKREKLPVQERQVKNVLRLNHVACGSVLGLQHGGRGRHRNSGRNRPGRQFKIQQLLLVDGDEHALNRRGTEPILRRCQRIRSGRQVQDYIFARSVRRRRIRHTRARVRRHHLGPDNDGLG